MDATTEPILRLHEHRRWSNTLLLKRAHELTAEQLDARFEIGQTTLWASLLHMFAAEFVWLETLLGNETAVAPGDLGGRLPGNQLGDNPIASLDVLTTLWTSLEDRWLDYLHQLSASQLHDLVYRVNSLTGVRSATRRLDILLHVCTHAHYTTAQANNMLRSLGEKAIDPMLISLARAQPAAD